jgi:hypothetical protein
MPGELEKKFADYPECCRKVLIELERDQRTGARNCAKGHQCRVGANRPPAPSNPPS